MLQMATSERLSTDKCLGLVQGGHEDVLTVEIIKYVGFFFGFFFTGCISENTRNSPKSIKPPVLVREIFCLLCFTVACLCESVCCSLPVSQQ